MTPEAQRIAIAEACGWTAVRNCGGDGTSWTARSPEGERHDHLAGSPQHAIYHNCPDYPADLNAMHEAEKTLRPMGVHVVRDYFEALDHVCGNRFESVSATAAQRAESFLRTIGQWQETAPAQK